MREERKEMEGSREGRDKKGREGREDEREDGRKVGRESERWAKVEKKSSGLCLHP